MYPLIDIMKRFLRGWFLIKLFPTLHISFTADVDEIRKKEFEQTKSIYRLLNMVDTHMDMTDDLIAKGKTYYDFLMTTPLKNYISPCTKVEGKSFHQMENEFMLYYRMVRGLEKSHEEMD